MSWDGGSEVVVGGDEEIGRRTEVVRRGEGGEEFVTTGGGSLGFGSLFYSLDKTGFWGHRSFGPGWVLKIPSSSNLVGELTRGYGEWVKTNSCFLFVQRGTQS